MIEPTQPIDPIIMRLGQASSEDDDLPPLPQPPCIRYVPVPVQARFPLWLRCTLIIALGLALAGLGDTLTEQYQRDGRWAWLPTPDLATPLRLKCDPACAAPTYCDSATGTCVADAAIANEPTARRSGTEQYP